MLKSSTLFYFVIIHSTPSLLPPFTLRPMQVVGGTLGETPFIYYLRIILVLGAFRGLCSV
jgi:hypothetical protein